MKNIILFIAAFILWDMVCLGQEIKYLYKDIDTNLLKNANAVIRAEEIKYTVSSDNKKATMYRKLVITILNEKAIDYGDVEIGYDSYVDVSYVKGRVYDKDGKVIKKSKKKHILDICNFGSMAFFHDNRVKMASLSAKKYPYTVEWEYEINYSSTFYFPSNAFYSDRDVAVEKAGFQVVIPANSSFRYLPVNMKHKVDSTSDGKVKTYTWQEENIPARKREIAMPPAYEVFASLLTTPNSFVMDKYAGDLSSWKSFGNWICLLNEGRNDLSSETKKKILNMVSGITDPKEKVKKIYEYMQNRTRYVLITLGMGGLQPLPASFVDKYGYGDCKALSNYCKAMLEVAGIKSHYTLAQSGDDAKEIKTNFPSNQFDHVFLTVPMEKDTIWLECTSQTTPFGFLSDFTSDRWVLMIDKDASKLIRTSKYDMNKSRMGKTGEISISRTGIGKGIINLEASGLNYDWLARLNELGSEDIKKWLYEELEMPTFLIKETTMQLEKSLFPSASLRADLLINSFGARTNDRLIFKPHIAFTKDYFSTNDKRENDIYVAYSSSSADSIVYIMPDDYKVEALPESKSFANTYGSYSYKMVQDGKKLVFTRRYQLNKGRYPVAEYTKFFDFMNQIARYDNQRVVLVSTEI
jgi:hypothetical protein